MIKISEEQKLKNKLRRKKIDGFLKISTWIASFVGVFTLIAIFVYVFSQGSSLVSLKLIIGDYYPPEYHLSVEPNEYCYCEEPEDLEENAYWSSKWGVAAIDSENSAGEDVVKIHHVADGSPFHDMLDNDNGYININFPDEIIIKRIIFDDNTFVISRNGAQRIIETLDAKDTITELYGSGLGGGIRGSLISTLYMIFYTLIFSLPLGIFTAIYLNEYAKKGWITNQLRRFIEMLTGVPSIIFGLVGLVVFIPITSTIGFEGRNIIAAALTLTVIIIPTIIRSTEESLKVIPNDLRQASLALGANSTQTTFKVVLPNALPGILTATLLGIGRVIGESAALIFVMGTTINDHVTLEGGSTSLAVQIWSVMGGEHPNFELASAISLIILGLVLILNLTVKYITYRLNKAWH